MEGEGGVYNCPSVDSLARSLLLFLTSYVCVEWLIIFSRRIEIFALD